MRTTIFMMIIAVSMLFVSATVWEGVSDVAAAKDKPGNYSVATNAFPRNSVVEITNLENGKTVRVIVVSGLEKTTGLLATLSRNAAEALELRDTSTCRVRMSQPSDDIAFANFRLGPVELADNDLAQNDMWNEPQAEPVPYVASGNSAGNRAAEPASREASVQTAVAQAPLSTVAKTAEPAVSPAVVTEPVAEAATADEVYFADDVYAPVETVLENTALAESLEPEVPAAEAATAEAVIAETAAEEPTAPAIAEVPVAETPIAQTPIAQTAFAEYVFKEPAAEEASPVKEVSATEQSANAIIGKTIIENPPPVTAVATTTTTAATPATAESNPDRLSIVPSEERVPSDPNQVVLAPEHFAPPIKQQPAARTVETRSMETRQTAVTKTPAAASSMAASNPPPSEFSPFQVPLISRLEKGKWYVQVGVFTRADYVEDEVTRIGKGYPLAVQNVGTDTSPMFRVLLGPLNQGESEAMLQRFKSIGYSDAFVRYN